MASPTGRDPASPPSKKEKAQLRELVSGIVVVQGNLFIKELLRKKDITIGRTKKDFEANLMAAVEDGRLRLADVEEWLAEVEGWGDQHIYLWKLPSDVVPDELFQSEDALRKRLARAKLADLLGAPTTHAFPEEQQLTGIQHSPDSIRFVWHKGVAGWTRAKEKDKPPEEEEDGEVYEYRAYRQRSDRSIMRLELRRKRRLAAAFLQIPWDRTTHEEARAKIADAVRAFIDIDRLEPVGLSDAIKSLNKPKQQGTHATRAKQVTPEQTRMNDGVAAVEFSSMKKGQAYTDSTTIRHAWSALKTERLTATMGIFSFPRGETLPRVRFGLFSLEKRIHLHSRLHAEQVWEILELVERSA